MLRLGDNGGNENTIRNKQRLSINGVQHLYECLPRRILSPPVEVLDRPMPEAPRCPGLWSWDVEHVTSTGQRHLIAARLR